MKPATIIFSLLIAVLLVLSQTLYTVDQRKYVAVFQFGELVDIKNTAGLYAKLPFMQNIVVFEKRILTLDSPEAVLIQTAEKKNVLVDSFVKWKIVDPKRFYTAMTGDERKAAERLRQNVDATLQEEFGKRTIHDVVSGERDKLMEVARERANQDARSFGVEIVDVRLKRVELPQNVSASVYDRMQAERKRVANELRSEGAAESEKIRAEADRERQVILAEANKQAQEIKGKGDARASAIYASAYGQNSEFYTFYRSLEAYKASFQSKNDILILEPNAEFFKYLKNSGTAKPSK